MIFDNVLYNTTPVKFKKSLNVTWLFMTYKLVWAFYKLIIHQNFHTMPSLNADREYSHTLFPNSGTTAWALLGQVTDSGGGILLLEADLGVKFSLFAIYFNAITNPNIGKNRRALAHVGIQFHVWLPWHFGKRLSEDIFYYKWDWHRFTFRYCHWPAFFVNLNRKISWCQYGEKMLSLALMHYFCATRAALGQNKMARWLCTGKVLMGSTNLLLFQVLHQYVTDLCFILWCWSCCHFSLNLFNQKRTNNYFSNSFLAGMYLHPHFWLSKLKIKNKKIHVTTISSRFSVGGHF